MALLRSSKRPPPPLKDTDCDHEIRLIDCSQPAQALRKPPNSSSTERPLSSELSVSSSRSHSDAPLRKHKTPQKLQQEITKRKYSKYQDRQNPGQTNDIAEGTIDEPTDDIISNGDLEERGRIADHRSPDSAIDILYENQRGWFLCGMPLFSANALGNLDPAPWTNCALKTSATNITNAQVPDPTWEWAWKDWSVNHCDEVDEDGWEYSFAFARQFSWHDASWWNSFVRRRAWIRKRVKKDRTFQLQEAHMLSSEYFTVNPVLDKRKSSSTLNQAVDVRQSIIQLARREMDDETVLENIEDIETLMRALKTARIDREKMEAVENFLLHGGEDIYHLRDRMHDVMRMFIFQASRRLLLSHVIKMFDEASQQQDSDGNHSDSVLSRRVENLQAALKHADEEVKRLEFWSDVKHMAEKGEIQGAVDESQGWDATWAGLDESGPKPVISERDLSGQADCNDREDNGTATFGKLKEKVKGKGKGKGNGKGKGKENT